MGFIAAFVFIFEGRALVRDADSPLKTANVCFMGDRERAAIQQLEAFYNMSALPSTRGFYFVGEDDAGNSVEHHVRLYQVWDTVAERMRFKACL